MVILLDFRMLFNKEKKRLTGLGLALVLFVFLLLDILYFHFL